MFELCDERLKTQVKSGIVDDDFHVIDNLVSRVPSKRKCGFKPASYVSGALSVDIAFSFPVSIASLQFSTACSRQSQAQVWVSKHGSLSPETPTSRSYFTLLRTAQLAPPSPVTVTLSRDADSRGHVSCDGELRGDPVLFYPDSYMTRCCQYLRITLSSCGSDRWIGNLQILGDVGILSETYMKRSKKTKKEILAWVNRMKMDAKKEEIPPSTAAPSLAQISCAPGVSSKGDMTGQSVTITTERVMVKLEDHIPEEFIDPITREIMTCPVILPSGNVVDSSTLDRHRDEEMKWGREMNDPFTGVVMKDVGALFHTSLMERIDTWRTETVGVGGGRSVGVGNVKMPLSLQILNRNAKRKYPDTEERSKLCSKRLKKLQLKNGTEMLNTQGESKFSNSGLVFETKSSPRLVNSKETKEIIINSKQAECESFSVEKTLASLAKHEERLNTF